MKFKFNPADQTLEIESNDREVYCLACGKYIGIFHLLKDDLPAAIDTFPLCHLCFKEKVGKMAELKLHG